MIIRNFTFLLSLFIAVSVPCQHRFKNLVMEGGGIRGIAYIGALQVLDSAGMLNGIERVGGTSAGAIQACLLAVGYSPAEILQALQSTSFRQFNDGGFMVIPGAVRLSRQMGWYKGEALTKWLEEQIARKTGRADITFQELHEFRKQGGCLSLYITATDLSWQVLRVFSHETYPNMRIADAVRISSSIPFYFKPTWMDSTGRCFDVSDSMLTRSLVVDGGLLANYPLAVFDSTRYTDGSLPNSYVKNQETVGLQLEEPWIVDSPSMRSQQPFPIADNSSYLKAIYKLLVDKPVMDMDRTVLISNLSLSPRIRQLPEKDVEQLLESGRSAAIKFLEQHR